MAHAAQRQCLGLLWVSFQRHYVHDDHYKSKTLIEKYSFTSQLSGHPDSAYSVLKPMGRLL